jgi:hypothetical protein
MAMVARSESVAAEVREIKRYARVAEIKRASLSLTAISDDKKVITESCNQPVLNLSDAVRWLRASGEAEPRAALGGIGRMPRRVRPLFIFPQNARLQRVLLSCVCRRRAGDCA